MSERLIPTRFERLLQGSEARELMFERNRQTAAFQITPPEHFISTERSPQFWQAKLATLVAAGISVPLAISIVACGAGARQPEAVDNSLAIYDLRPKEKPDGEISPDDVLAVKEERADFTGDGQSDGADEAVVQK